MMNEFQNRRKETPLLVPASLLLLCILAFGLLIPTLGYYWDDWPYAYINHMFGPGGYPEFVSSDRPHSAWIFIGLTTILGEKPLGYHISSVLFFWLCAVLFWHLLRTLWPQRKKEALWGALLFTVYPGFLGHPNAIIYNHHYIAMGLYFISMIGTVKAVQGGRKAWLWHVPAVLAMILSQFSIEYFIGWESARLVMVWYLVNRKNAGLLSRLKIGFINLLPYWMGTLGFLIWRVIVFGFPTYQPLGGGEVDPVSERFVLTILKETLDAVLFVWRRAFPHFESDPFSEAFWLIYLGISLLTALFVLLLLVSRRDQGDDLHEKGVQTKNGFGLYGIAIALSGILTAGWPFWLTGLSVSIQGFYSRFTLAFIPWAVLLMVGILSLVEKWLFDKRPMLIIVFISFLVGGSAGWQVWNANRYRNDWQELERYMMEMVHRIPGLEPGTTLIINDMRFLDLYSDNSLTALVNWTYSPDMVSKDLNYMVYYLSVRLGLGLPALEPGLPIYQDYRSLHFNGSTDKLLVVYSDLEGCLRVLDGSHPDRLPTTFPGEMSPALPLSNLSLIRTDMDRPTLPENIFSHQAEQTWCYLFEEADLAAQIGDWSYVASIGDRAYALEDKAEQLTEHFVFIEGYLREGQIDRAWALSTMVSESAGKTLNGALCNLWREIEAARGGQFDVDYNIFCSGK